jgi:hypothetical protein
VLPVMRSVASELNVPAATRTEHTQRLRIQRLLSVAIRQKPGVGAKTIDKMRIADRPDGFSAATESVIGARGGKVNAYRHIIEFDVLKRRWKKDLKGISLAKVDSLLRAGYMEANSRLPSSYPKKGLKVRGRNPLEQAEEFLKDILTIEFNNPNNLWLGPSADNSARGAAGKAAKNALKASNPNSKYQKANPPLTTAQAVSDQHYRNFAMRLDLDPTGNTVTHMQQLDDHQSFYARAFNKPGKYGDPAQLAARFKVAWQQGYADRNLGAVNANVADTAYHSGARAWEVDEREGYLAASHRRAPQARLAHDGFKAGVERLLVDYKQGYTDAGAHTIAAGNTTGGYLLGVREFREAYRAAVGGDKGPWNTAVAKLAARAAGAFFNGVQDGAAGHKARTLIKFQYYYDDGYRKGKQNPKTGKTPPASKAPHNGKPGKLQGVAKKTGTGKKPTS